MSYIEGVVLEQRYLISIIIIIIIITTTTTPWCRVLLEKLTGLHLVKEFPAFHGPRRFITALTSFLHSSLSWASPFQSIYPRPTSWRTVVILSSHLRLGLASVLFPLGFGTKTLYAPPPHPFAPHAQPISFFYIYYYYYCYYYYYYYYWKIFLPCYLAISDCTVLSVPVKNNKCM